TRRSRPAVSSRSTCPESDGAEMPSASASSRSESPGWASTSASSVAWCEVTPSASVSRRRFRARRRSAGRSSPAISSGERVASRIIREAKYISCDRLLGCRFELVADAVARLEERVPRRAAVDLLAELADEDVDRPVPVGRAAAPDALQQLVARQDPTGLQGERVGEAKLGWRQVGALAVDV